MATYDIVSMVEELTNANAPLEVDLNWDSEEYYNYIIHMYDVWFLVNNYEHREESKRYRPSGIRISSGPYKGKFPT